MKYYIVNTGMKTRSKFLPFYVFNWVKCSPSGEWENKYAQAAKITRKKKSLRFRFSSISHVVRNEYPGRCQASIFPVESGIFFPLLNTWNLSLKHSPLCLHDKQNQSKLS